MPTAAPRRAAILLVEDEAAVRSVLARGLERAGYRVVEATDGLEALELLDGSIAFSVIITDIRMPAMDGLVFALAVRRQHGDIPLLMMSAFPEPERLPPTTQFLSKPFPLEALLERVQSLIGKS